MHDNFPITYKYKNLLLLQMKEELFTNFVKEVQTLPKILNILQSFNTLTLTASINIATGQGNIIHFPRIILSLFENRKQVNKESQNNVQEKECSRNGLGTLG